MNKRSSSSEDNLVYTHISAFDLDHTLFNDNSTFRFGLYLCHKRILPFSALFFIVFTYVRHLLGFLSIAEVHKKAYHQLVHGFSEQEVAECVEEFLRHSFNGLIYQPALKKLEQAQSAGHLTVILSSSPEFIVGPIAKRLNVPCWKATTYAIDKDRRFCHISQAIESADKVNFINELCGHYHCQKENITAYSDNYLDLPFLLAAGKAVGVNPDRKLAAFCRRNNWQII